jgi:hypothetical protein
MSSRASGTAAPDAAKKRRAIRTLAAIRNVLRSQGIDD